MKQQVIIPAEFKLVPRQMTEQQLRGVMQAPDCRRHRCSSPSGDLYQPVSTEQQQHTVYQPHSGWGVNLPVAMATQANMRALLKVSFEGLILPAGHTQLHIEILPGNAYGQLVASGSGDGKAYITAANVVSGAFGVLTFSGTYKYLKA